LFAIVKSAGADKGHVRSVHKSFAVALRAQPATFFKLCPASPEVRKGQIRPDLLNNPAWDAKWRAA
jgi:hypothetical protein